MNSLRVAVLCGSMAPDSSAHRAARLTLEGLPPDTRIEWLDLATLRLPFAASTAPGREGEGSDAALLRETLRASHGQLWVTPEYHGAPTGAFKNALDLCGFDEFEGKAIALIATAGGSTGGVLSLNQMRLIARHLHAWCLPSQVSVARSSQTLPREGAPDAALAQRLRALGAELAHFSTLLRDATPPDAIGRAGDD